MKVSYLGHSCFLVLFNGKKLFFSEHHLSHAASAFYPSPFDSAAVLTLDGVGEWATTTVAIGKQDRCNSPCASCCSATLPQRCLFVFLKGLFRGLPCAVEAAWARLLGRSNVLVSLRATLPDILPRSFTLLCLL